MLVAASTECFGNMPLQGAIDRLVDLEYTNIEIAIHEDGPHLRPSEVEADFERAITLCTETRRLNVVGYNVRITATGEDYYRQFHAICRLAKATKVVTLIVFGQWLFLDESLYSRPIFMIGILLFVLGVQVIGFGLVGEIIIYTQANKLREYRIERIYEK